MPGIPEQERGEGPPSHGAGGHGPADTGFQLPASSCEEMHGCCLQSAGVRSLVTAATGHSYLDPLRSCPLAATSLRRQRPTCRPKTSIRTLPSFRGHSALHPSLVHLSSVPSLSLSSPRHLHPPAREPTSQGLGGFQSLHTGSQAGAQGTLVKQ